MMCTRLGLWAVSVPLILGGTAGCHVLSGSFACETDVNCPNDQKCCRGECKASCSNYQPPVVGCTTAADCTRPTPCFQADGATCEEQKCVYPPVDCLTPPESVCVENNTVYRSYGVPGTCEPTTGRCTYEAHPVICEGCAVNCLGRCAGVDCTQTAQFGSCVRDGWCVPNATVQCQYSYKAVGEACALTETTTGVCSETQSLTGPQCVDCNVGADCNALSPAECFIGTCTLGSCAYTPSRVDPTGVCAGVNPLGMACLVDDDCASSHCANDVCCESACAGVCEACGIDGLCNEAPVDDARCGVIACSDLDTTCRAYTDLSAQRCLSFGQCKQANTTVCTGFTDTTGVCRASTGSCDPAESCSAGACPADLMTTTGGDCTVTSSGDGKCTAAHTCLLEDGRTCTAAAECYDQRCLCADSYCSTRACAVAAADTCATCTYYYVYNYGTGSYYCTASYRATQGYPGIGCTGPGQVCNGASGAGSCKAANGQPCTSDTECVSTYCVAANVDGTSSVCSQANCTQCKYNTDGNGTCDGNVRWGVDDPSAPCTGDRACNGNGACHLAPIRSTYAAADTLPSLFGVPAAAYAEAGTTGSLYLLAGTGSDEINKTVVATRVGATIYRVGVFSSTAPDYFTYSVTTYAHLIDRLAGATYAQYHDTALGFGRHVLVAAVAAAPWYLVAAPGDTKDSAGATATDSKGAVYFFDQSSVTAIGRIAAPSGTSLADTAGGGLAWSPSATPALIVAQDAFTGGPARSVAFYNIVASPWSATLESTWAYNNADPDLSGASADEFGAAVVVANGVAFVGDPGADGGSGAVYVFKLATGAWTPTGKIASPESGISFGESLAYATQLFVGSDSSTDAVGANPLAGAGAVFAYNTPGTSPVLADKVVAPSRSAGAQFGAHVAGLESSDRLLAVGGSTGNGLSVFKWNASAGPPRYDSLSQVGPARSSGSMNAPVWAYNTSYGATVLFGGDNTAIDPANSNVAEGAIYVFRRNVDF